MRDDDVDGGRIRRFVIEVQHERPLDVHRSVLPHDNET